MTIDFHSHIIPSIDDGSLNMDMTIEMIEEECEQGVETVVVTPHFYASRKSIQGFLDKRLGRLEEMSEMLDGVIIRGADTVETVKRKTGTEGRCVHIIPGAEVYYFQGMSRAERLTDLCIGETGVILVEMPFVQWTEEIYRDIKQIITNRGLKVVLAHIERYPEFQKSKDIWNKVMDLPLTTQLNAGSFLKGWRRRKFCIDWIKQRPASVIGSDAHNMTSRPPNIKPAREVIGRKAGKHILEEMDRTAAGLLGI